MKLVVLRPVVIVCHYSGFLFPMLLTSLPPPRQPIGAETLGDGLDDVAAERIMAPGGK
jgi:hypothetical protein